MLHNARSAARVAAAFRALQALALARDDSVCSAVAAAKCHAGALPHALRGRHGSARGMRYAASRHAVARVANQTRASLRASCYGVRLFAASMSAASMPRQRE